MPDDQEIQEERLFRVVSFSSMTHDSLRNISDTALWVAQYRVMETERPDAHFRDPLAKKLVGDRGEADDRAHRGDGRDHPALDPERRS
jgi:O-methyltransferase involved in polyketide biosynthesis